MEITTDRLAQSLCQSVQDAQTSVTSSFDIDHFGEGAFEELIAEIKERGPTYDVRLKGVRLPAFAVAQVNHADGKIFDVPAAVMAEWTSKIEIIIEPVPRR